MVFKNSLRADENSMKKQIKTEIISTIRSKKDLETFFEALSLVLGEETILRLLNKARKLSEKSRNK